MKKLLGFGVLLIALVATFYITLPVISIHFLQVPIIIAGAALVLVVFAFAKGVQSDDHGKYKLTGIQNGTLGILAVALLYLIVACVSMFPLFNWKSKQAELKVVQIEKFDDSVPNVDMQNLVILDEENALRNSERLITETNPTLGSQFQIGEGTLTVVESKPYWIFPLEYRGFFKWLGNKGEIPGYIKINATNANDAEFVEYTYNLSPSGYFGSDLKRAIYAEFPQYGLTDMSFEVDDQGEGKWVVTAYTHKDWVSTPHVTGSIVVDPASGAMTFYEVGAQPKWVNRVFSMAIFDQQLEWYGKYIEGWWNPSDKGKLEDTSGKGYVFKDGELYFYTGLTSVGKDSATTGFVIYNPRTGEAEYNKLSGSIESRAMGLMEELVQNAGYTATYPYLINLNGEPTYFSTMKGNSGNIVGYAFASVQNPKAVAYGKTLREAQTEYSRALVREGGGNSLANQSNSAESFKGTVSRVGALGDGYFALKCVGDNRLFVISSEQYPLIALTEAGDSVTLTYIETTETERVDALTFKNDSIR